MTYKHPDIPVVTFTKATGGRPCDLCAHKPFFIEEDVFWQHMEEFHAIYHLTRDGSPDGGLEKAINNILSLHSSPHRPKKVLIIGSALGIKLRELLKKTRFRRE